MTTTELPGKRRMREIGTVEAAVAEVCGHLHAASGRLVELTAEALEREVWIQEGIGSPEHWLTWKTGVAQPTARRIVAAARRFHELPVTMAAAVAGELSLDQISPIVAKAPSWADSQVCELARSCTVSQIRTAVGRYPFEPDTQPDQPDEPDAAEPDAAESSGSADPTDPAGSVEPEPERAGDPGSDDRPTGLDDPGIDHSEPEHFSLVQGDDGRWRLSGVLDADHGLMLDAALREIIDRHLHQAGRLPNRADALVELARSHTANIDDHSRRDRYRVYYMLNEHHQLVDPYGTALPAWLRDLICCDPAISIIWQRHGTPIARNSVADLIDPAVRRHVLARDTQCRVPGCGRRRNLHLHHIRHREHGGTNDTYNLCALCPSHHRMHHRGHLGITGNADDPDGLVFTNRHGTVLQANTLIRPPTGPPPDTRPYQHPLGERLHTKWIHFHPPPGHPHHPTRRTA